MIRQVAFLLAIVIVILLLGQIVLYLKPEKSVTVHFKEGVAPRELSGQVSKKDKYIIVKPDDGSEEQVYTWDQVRSISGTEPTYAKKIDEVTELIELLAKLGVLAAAGVFLVGLYQFDVGQTWKREEFLAGMVNDFGRRQTVENAKKMIELLMFYPQGRKIDLYPERENSEMVHVSVDQIGKALAPDLTNRLTDDEMRIRESFDSFLSRLERFEHYIESKLTSDQSVYIYLGFWIDALLGKGAEGRGEPRLKREYREWIRRYAHVYEFPMYERLLSRYSREPWWLRRLKAKRTRLTLPDDGSASTPSGQSSAAAGAGGGGPDTGAPSGPLPPPPSGAASG